MKTDELECKEIRKLIVEEIHKCAEQNGHLGGCLSSVEILYTIYKYVSNITKDNIRNSSRDRVLLSKAHAGLALFSTMAEVGLISKESLINSDVRGSNSIYNRQPQLNPDLGIEFAGGSLGLAPSYGCGLAIHFKQSKTNQKVFVVVGDGEMQEGSVWESLIYIASHKLDNFYLIVDKNNLQLDGKTSEIINMDFVGKTLESIGFKVFEVDGHSVAELKRCFASSSESRDKPIAIIANTIKGKGVSFCENNYLWHDNYLTDDLYRIAMEELNRE